MRAIVGLLLALVYATVLVGCPTFESDFRIVGASVTDGGGVHEGGDVDVVGDRASDAKDASADAPAVDTGVTGDTGETEATEAEAGEGDATAPDGGCDGSTCPSTDGGPEDGAACWSVGQSCCDPSTTCSGSGACSNAGSCVCGSSTFPCCVNATCAPACSGVAVCQPPPGSYTIGGIVDGLLAGQQIELANNAFWYLVVTGNGEFTFGTPLATGDGYLVEVQMGPDAGPDAGCFVMNSGGMIADANITNVAVMCP